MDNGFTLSVTEQSLTKTSIYCEMKLTYGSNCSVSYGRMYFVCNLERVVTQYPNWMDKSHIKQLNALGYKL